MRIIGLSFSILFTQLAYAELGLVDCFHRGWPGQLSADLSNCKIDKKLVKLSKRVSAHDCSPQAQCNPLVFGPRVCIDSKLKFSSKGKRSSNTACQYKAIQVYPNSDETQSDPAYNAYIQAAIHAVKVKQIDTDDEDVFTYLEEFVDKLMYVCEPAFYSEIYSESELETHQSLTDEQFEQRYAKNAGYCEKLTTWVDEASDKVAVVKREGLVDAADAPETPNSGITIVGANRSLFNVRPQFSPAIITPPRKTNGFTFSFTKETKLKYHAIGPRADQESGGGKLKLQFALQETKTIPAGETFKINSVYLAKDIYYRLTTELGEEYEKELIRLLNSADKEAWIRLLFGEKSEAAKRKYKQMADKFAEGKELSEDQQEELKQLQELSQEFRFPGLAEEKESPFAPDLVFDLGDEKMIYDGPDLQATKFETIPGSPYLPRPEGQRKDQAELRTKFFVPSGFIALDDGHYIPIEALTTDNIDFDVQTGRLIILKSTVAFLFERVKEQYDIDDELSGLLYSCLAQDCPLPKDSPLGDGLKALIKLETSNRSSQQKLYCLVREYFKICRTDINEGSSAAELLKRLLTKLRVNLPPQPRKTPKQAYDDFINCE